ncbi:MAG TPA: glutathione S-transferase family protein [Paracoccaceae bacterium]|nr:glutathione S-transferase family protein [Paracoccaceae bacterium]
MVKLYGVARSRATRAIWLMGEIGIGYEHVPVIQAYRLKDPNAPDAPLNTLSPAFLALSPAGAIPVLEDEGFVLSESVAINLYLAKTYGGDLGPRDGREEALMLQWGLYGATAIEADALVILYAMGEGRADAAEVTAARARLARPLAALQAHLVAEGHMVGRRLTVADINMAEMVRYAAAAPGLVDDYPAVKGWLARLHERAAFKAMWAMRLAEPE